MSYKISWETRTIFITWTGNATGADLLVCVKEVHASPNFDHLRYSLHDFTACTGASFPVESIDLIAALDFAAAMSNSHIKVGVATARDDVKAMVNNYMGTKISPYPVRIFPTVKEMREWEAKDRAGQ